MDDTLQWSVRVEARQVSANVHEDCSWRSAAEARSAGFLIDTCRYVGLRRPGWRRTGKRRSAACGGSTELSGSWVGPCTGRVRRKAAV